MMCISYFYGNETLIKSEVKINKFYEDPMHF